MKAEVLKWSERSEEGLISMCHSPINGRCGCNDRERE